MRWLLSVCWFATLFWLHGTAAGLDRRVISVGPTRAIKNIATAAVLARPGAIIEVDSGTYEADVAVWTQDRLTLRSVGGRVRLLAAGAAAESKAIWVVRANMMRVEGFDFEGAAVPDKNGAGIRFEKGSLHLADCRFTHNEMGLLTSNDPDAVLEIENSEFAYNQRPDGHNHNLYVGQIARLAVTGSYFHHAHIGHLLKSRAAVNLIYYNRLTDEPGGSASYELEFPNGGLAVVVGNVIEQGIGSDNPVVVSFGAEGYKWARNEIYLSHNTLVDLLPQGGTFLRVATGAGHITAVNNVLVGRGKLDVAGGGVYQNNFNVGAEAFEQPARGDYRLKPSAAIVGKAIKFAGVDTMSLNPNAEYVHPMHVQLLSGIPHNPGAVQRIAPSSSP